MYWSAGSNGTRWLMELANRGEATVLDKGGYPDAWGLDAGTLLRVLDGGVPKDGREKELADDGVIPPPRDLDLAPIRALPAGTRLVVAAWDMS